MAGGLPSSVSLAVEFTAGVWTELGSRTNRLTIRHGGGQPGTLAFTLENFDGLVTPGSPLGTYFPNMTEGKRIRVQVVKSSITYTRFVGRISKLTPVYGVTSTDDVVDVLATDLLGDLARMKLRPMIEALATAGALTGTIQAVYPMTETSGRRGAVDVLGQAQPLRVRSGGAAGSIKYAGTRDLGVDGQSFVEIAGLKMLAHQRTAISLDPVAGGVSIICYAKIVPDTFGELISISRGPRLADGTGQWQSVSVDHTDGIPQIWYSGQTASGLGIGGNPIDVEDGWIGIALTLDGSGAATLTTSTGGSSTLSPASDDTLPYNRITLGNLIGVGAAETAIAYVIVGGTANLEALVHSLEGENDTYPYAVADALTYLSQATDIASLGGALALSSTPPTTRSLTAVPYLGRSGLDVLLDLARTESGIVYHDYSSSATQTVKILSREDSRPLTAAITLDVELDIDADDPPAFARGVAELVATATAKTPEREVTVTDATLADIVGTTGVDVPSVLDDENEARSLAEDALATSRYSALRVERVTVDLVTAETDLYATAFAVTQGERVKLTNLAAQRFGVTIREGYVDTHEEVITPESHAITWGLLAADAPPEAHFDDSTYGRFGFGDGICTVTGGTAVGTTATGTITLTWTGSSALSTTAGDWPCDFDWNGERVTVTAVPSGSTSPRTLTITARGVGGTVARVHSAGEPIDIWNAARFAL